MSDVLQLKLLTIGDSGVGKSWLLMRWAGEGNKLKGNSMPTIGIDFKLKNVDVNGKKVKVQVWDTAGQERYRTITTSYYRNSQGILLIYDITSRSSFTNVRSWINQIQLHADFNVNKILIGNKCDLVQQRVISYEEGEALSREFKIKFIETSAINDINVDEAFMRITTEVYNRVEKGVIINGNSKQNQKKFSSNGFNDSNKDKPKPKSSFCLLI